MLYVARLSSMLLIRFVMKVVLFLCLVASDVSSSGDEDFEENDDEGSDFEVTHKSPPRKKTSERSAIKVKITQSVEGIYVDFFK